MAAFNYSKWDNIELSDDESDCHPNIDKQSWFRMKHRARVEREAKEEKETEDLLKANKQDAERIDELTAKIAAEDDEGDREAFEEELKDLEKAVEKREARIAEMEKNKKWNVDNMCHVVEERTIVSKGKDKLTTSELPPELAAVQASKEATRASAAAAADKAVAGPVTERSQVMSYADFTEKWEDLLEQYSVLPNDEATQKLLMGKGDILLQEHAVSYLLLSCLEEEMNGNHAKMRRVARQSQVLSHINELGLSLRRPARDVVVPFFKRISEPEHASNFADAVATFVDRIAKRAVDKRREMAEERARRKAAGEPDSEEEGSEEVELSREERLGPGGLDPVEVFETLPESLQEAFHSQDTLKLKAAIAAMPIDEAKYHMKRCEDSGLWVPER